MRIRHESVVNEARCGVALQQQVVVGSMVARGGDLATPRPVVPSDEFAEARRRVPLLVLDIVDGVAVLDELEADKQADWSFDAIASGAYPGAASPRRRRGGQRAVRACALGTRHGRVRRCAKISGCRFAGGEKCESGRIGLTANELSWETGTQGSNPCFSAVVGGPWWPTGTRKGAGRRFGTLAVPHTRS